MGRGDKGIRGQAFKYLLEMGYVTVVAAHPKSAVRAKTYKLTALGEKAVISGLEVRDG
jgi:hypothetical protein